MRITVYSTRPYDRRFLTEANAAGVHDLVFMDARLDHHTAPTATGSAAVCAFVNDQLDAAVLHTLHSLGVRLVLLRSAGFNHVDLPVAAAMGLVVGRVPEYSPHAVAEHAAALVLTLNRKIHRAHARVREGNFQLDGLMGFDLHGSTVGLVGTGKIGRCFARIMLGFGCRVLAFDPKPSAEALAMGVQYTELPALLQASDIVSLHCPLTPATRHLLDAAALACMKPGAMLVNTSRGAVVDTRAVIAALKGGHLGSLGLDVYEEEGDLFFRDLSAEVLKDDVFARLLTFPNVIVTGHQAFFTEQALLQIARTTLDNATHFEATGLPLHGVTADKVV
ncbi:MAG: 2-hydroxyacid dehydrogenase [Rubrivivax sp.]|jgi:D-lactate dehydrogenase|nr:2-hydroxyacid dehydrogenase [Rubrivivax sp.]